MKELRGALIALLILLVLAALMYVREAEETTQTSKRLFSFEKHDLVAATIRRPNRETIRLVEKEGTWWIADTEWQANITMVNRIRHQLHDLEARATVGTDVDNFDLYGLGEDAISVELSLRSGKTIRFSAGDPNPTGVSYYIRPFPGDAVYTVKKSALDYYSASFDEFRNPHFLSFDAKGVRAFQVWKGSEEFRFYRLDEHRWALEEPEMRVSKERMRTMIGRAIALKSTQFIDLVEQNQEYGFSTPSLRIRFELDAEREISLLVGKESPDGQQSYFQVEGNPVVYVAKNGFVEEFDIQTEKLRNRDVLDLRQEEIQSVEIELYGSAQNTALLRTEEGWFGKDERPVSQREVEKLLSAFQNLQARDFVSEDRLGAVVGEARLFLAGGRERILRIGAPAMETKGKGSSGSSVRYAEVLRTDGDQAEKERVVETVVIDEYFLSLLREWGVSPDPQ